MITPLSIANAALRATGTRAISSFDEGSEISYDVNQFYEMSIEAFLSEYNWSFATREASLPRIDTSAKQFGTEDIRKNISNQYLYGYLLPADFLRLTGFTQPICKIEYNLRLYRSQMALFCNSEAVSIIYISRNISYDSLIASAREAIVFRLAMFLDSARNAGANIQRLNELYQGMLMSAKSFEPSTHDRKFLDEGMVNKVRGESWRVL